MAFTKFKQTVANYFTSNPKIVHEFKGENITKGKLFIKSHSSSCGCTSVKYSREVPPGPFVIEMTMDKGDNFKGFFAIDSRIEFTDGVNSEWITLAITGEVNDSVS